MPMNIAMTDAPIRCSPTDSSSCSKNLATTAMTSAMAQPGSIFFTDSINFMCFFLLQCVLRVYYITDL